MVTPSGGGTTGPVGGYPGQSYYEDEEPGYQQRGEREGDTERRIEEGTENAPGAGFPGQDAYQRGQFGTGGDGGSGESSPAPRPHRDRESQAGQAGYGPAPGSGSGGFGREAGFMNGKSDDPGAGESRRDQEDRGDREGREDIAEGGYPVEEGGSQFGERRTGDETRNRDQS